MSLLDRLLPSRQTHHRLRLIEESIQSLEAVHMRSLDELSRRVAAIEIAMGLAGRLGASDDGGSAVQLGDRIAEMLQWLQKISNETTNLLAHLDNRHSEALLWLEKVSSETSNQFSHLDSVLENTRGQVRNDFAELVLRLETLNVEIQSSIGHLQGEAITSFNRLFNNSLPTLGRQAHWLSALVMEQAARFADPSGETALKGERYEPASEQNFDEILDRAAQDFPEVYEAWRERLDATSEAFRRTVVGNAAHAGDLYSRMFSSFVKLHARGRVLDVGCGVFGRPYYLHSYPGGLISGIEPLEGLGAPDFERVRGIGEYLPWPDSSFTTVINATSLDHCVSLERSLHEMRRVLAPDGKLVLWIGSNAGAPEFTPESDDFEPIDDFHLFHFDTSWFDPMISKSWDTVDRLEFDLPSFAHVFYALTPRKGG
jgi:SAM-dependent methyltransferase